MSKSIHLLASSIATLALVVVAGAQTPQPVAEAGKTFFVSAAGSDDNPGTKDKPFATLERARDQIRSLNKAGGLPKGGLTVQVRGGLYQRQRSFDLTAEDSGTADSPITYAPAKEEQVTLSGGRIVNVFKPVTNPRILDRLDISARSKVLCADLRTMGIVDFGLPSGGGLELFFRDQPMTLARWPNEGFVKIVDVVGGQPVDVRGTKGDKAGKFFYEDDRPKRWAQEPDLWLHGYWFWDWSDQRQKVESIDTQKRVLSLAPPYHSYGYRKGQWYYAFNALCELDSPGEWYLDRKAGVLYFWPPADIARDQVCVSVLTTLVTMKDVSHVRIVGMTLQACRGTAVTVEGGEHDTVGACGIRNVGGWAVRVSGGAGHEVLGCDIFQTGGGGISLSGGDRVKLIPANHRADNNHIHHFARWNRMYNPGVELSGVGLSVTHNLIHDAPHEGIQFYGNDFLIEFNEIHHVCTEANDAGAIYAGRDWTTRGTIIRYNYLHQITGFQNRGCVGVYLDDMYCGTTIRSNLFYQVTRAAFIGGGRDNIVQNNLFVECSPALHIDARAQGWAGDSVGGVMTERLLAMPYLKPPWSQRFPELVNILQDEPAAPKGNRIEKNICLSGQWQELDRGLEKVVHLQDNLVIGDANLVNAAKGDFRLKDDSQARKIGFEPLPLEKIGLYQGQYRPTLPGK
jgi:hypothetical protein